MRTYEQNFRDSVHEDYMNEIRHEVSDQLDSERRARRTAFVSGMIAGGLIATPIGVVGIITFLLWWNG